MSSVNLHGRVAVVTGAGVGLGRAHALALAAAGAKVVVNDLNGDAPDSAAQETVVAIQEAGGQAMVDGGDVTSFEAMQAMVAKARDAWGRVDIVVNNAGILRDRTFAKMPLEDFRQVLEVHLMGSVHVTKAAWELMREQRYGRVVLTTSSSGLFGNFGQANYGAAKLALVGLMQTLGLEGERYDIKVNCLAPTAATAMTEGLMSEEVLAQIKPEYVSPAVVALASEAAPNRKILLAGANGFEMSHITMTKGVTLEHGPNTAAELLARLNEVADRTDAFVPVTGFDQARFELSKAGLAEDAMVVGVQK